MTEQSKSGGRKKRKFPLRAAVAGGVVVLAAGATAAGAYIHQSRQYETVFFPSTIINGIDASNRTVAEVEAMISSDIDGYALTLIKRGGETEQITKEDMDLHSVFDGTLEQHLEAQNPMEWRRHRNQVTEFEIETMIAWDEEKLVQKIDSLEMFDEESVRSPQDAYLSDYIPGEGFKVLEGDPGTALNREKVIQGVRDAVGSLKTELDLEELGAYETAAVTVEDPKLNEKADRLNRYVTMTVTYRFGEKQEILDGDTIIDWIRVEENGDVTVSQEAVTAYVKELASSYNTAYQPKTLVTSYGETVEITKGFYGWRIDQAEEAKQLYEVLMSGESQAREPVYLQKGASHGEHDYGNTYVEINLTAQHLFFYKNGKLVVESDFVSGNQARGYDTPSGAYPLNYKQRNAVLKGATYRTPVSYWMPFNGNIGMHDAGWRGAFGGNIYKTNGSHGCINLPPQAAKTIFENIEAGTPVLCYHLNTAAGTPSATSGSQTTAAGSGQSKNPAGAGQENPAGQTGSGEGTEPSGSQPGTVQPAEGEDGQISGEVSPREDGNTSSGEVTPKADGEQETAGGESGPGTGPGTSGEIGPGVGGGGPGEIGPGTGPGNPGGNGPGVGDAASGGNGPGEGSGNDDGNGTGLGAENRPSGPGEIGSQS